MTKQGSANAVLNGSCFEKTTDNKFFLLNKNYSKNIFTNKKLKYNYSLCKKENNKSITFVMQHGFVTFMKLKYNIDVFRYPDEAYIIEYSNGTKKILIIEKKDQTVNGSVETKLWSSPSLKREYEIVLGDNFEVHYSLCINDFLQNKLSSIHKKYTSLKQILDEANITILFGNSNDYFISLYNLINSI